MSVSASVSASVSVSVSVSVCQQAPQAEAMRQLVEALADRDVDLY